MHFSLVGCDSVCRGAPPLLILRSFSVHFPSILGSFPVTNFDFLLFFQLMGGPVQLEPGGSLTAAGHTTQQPNKQSGVRTHSAARIALASRLRIPETAELSSRCADSYFVRCNLDHFPIKEEYDQLDAADKQQRRNARHLCCATCERERKR